MPYCLPSILPGSARPGIQSAPPRSATLSVRSFTPPLAEYSATWVLPTSITSGASLLARALITFWPMPSHSWIWMSRVTPAWDCWKAVLKRSSTGSEKLSRMTQTVSLVALALAVPSGAAAVSDEELHAVRPTESAAAVASKRYLMGSPSGQLLVTR